MYLQLRRACMNPHADLDRNGSPCLVMQLSLCIQRGVQCITGGVERRGKRIAYHLEDISVISFNCLMQDLIMSRQKHRHLIWMLLCQFGAAFDVGEEEGNRSRREIQGMAPVKSERNVSLFAWSAQNPA